MYDYVTYEFLAFSIFMRLVISLSQCRT